MRGRSKTCRRTTSVKGSSSFKRIIPRLLAGPLLTGHGGTFHVPSPPARSTPRPAPQALGASEAATCSKEPVANVASPETGLPAAGPRISVVIPTFDEERRIGTRLAELRELRGLHEVIVVDGGSRDRTWAIVQSHPDVCVVRARRGRALQMNAGAALASGDVLLFLHSDVGLPADAARWIAETLAEPAVVAGAFRTVTVCDVDPSWMAAALRLADLRSRYSSLPYGDQAIFVRAEVFRRLGGFPDQPLMEDLELSRRLRRIGGIRTVPATVRVSGRRFLARPLYAAFAANVLPLLYRIGVPVGLLSKLYGNAR